MTDTKAPSPVWDLLKGMAPYIGQALILLITAIISAVGGLYTAGFFSPAPAAPKIEIVKTVPAPNPVLETCQAAEQAVHTFRAEFHARFPERKVRVKRKATAAK